MAGRGIGGVVLGGAVAVVVVLGGCTPDGGPDDEAAQPSPSFVLYRPDEPVPEYQLAFAEDLADSLADPRAPQEFRERAEFASCGAFIVGQGAWDFEPPWQCLDAGRDAGAELVLVQPTVEGDPIVEYYRVGPGIAGLEMLVDATRDALGAREWLHVPCPDTVTAAEPAGCDWPE